MPPQFYNCYQKPFLRARARQFGIKIFYDMSQLVLMLIC